MPIILQTTAVEEVQQQDVEALLKTDDGKPSLEAQVIQEFLAEVDFTPIFDAEESREHVVVSTDYAKLEGEEYVEADEACKTRKKAAKEGKKDAEVQAGDEAVEEVEIETLTGEALAALVDEDDLTAMFLHHLAHLPEETIEEKAKKAVFGKYLSADDFQNVPGVEEGIWNKGDFRKVYKGTKKSPGGMTGPELVKRMLVAMMHKEAIKRAGGAKGYSTAGKSGSGYRGGDYEKQPGGYGVGTATGIRKWQKYKGLKAAQIKKGAKKTKGYAKAVAAMKAKAAAAKKGSTLATQTIGKGALPTKYQNVPAKAKKGLAASDDSAPANLTEGAMLTGKVLGIMSSHGASLTEAVK